MKVEVERRATRAFPGTGLARCGAAQVDITPPPGISMAGFSLGARTSRGTRGRLFARALYLEDASGVRAAWCVLDMMSASRYLLEKTASLAEPRCGISVDRLLLGGTHTHTAPGHFYGNSLYDTFAQKHAGFDRTFADWIASKAADAIARAEDAAVPAHVAIRTERVWGVAWNRSSNAFLKNPDAAWWWTNAAAPGFGVPDGLAMEQRAVDPRLTVLTAVSEQDRRVLAVFGTFACHATALGPTNEVYDADWVGAAVRLARAEMHAAGHAPVIAIAAGAGGDISPWRRGTTQGAALATDVGKKIARPLASAALASRDTATRFTLDVRFYEPDLVEPRVDGHPETELAPEWAFGVPTLAGAEDGRTDFYPVFAREGIKGDHYPPSHPQHPKIPTFGQLEHAIVRRLKKLSPSPRLPLHCLRIRGHAFVTVPGEPTVTAGYQIERALTEDIAAITSCTVLGYTGDYGGYYTTTDEYDEQTYEASSMLYGRHATGHVLGRLGQMLRWDAARPVQARTVTFDTVAERKGFAPGSAGGDARDPRAVVERKPGRITVGFRTDPKLRVDFSEGPFVRVERLENGSWEPLLVSGRPLDDVHTAIYVARRGFTDEAHWTVRIYYPATITAPLRVRVLPRAGFPGFVV